MDTFDYKVAAILGFAFDDAMTRPVAGLRAAFALTTDTSMLRGVIQRGIKRGVWTKRDERITLTRTGMQMRARCREAFIETMAADPERLASIIEKVKNIQGGK